MCFGSKSIKIHQFCNIYNIVVCEIHYFDRMCDSDKEHLLVFNIKETKNKAQSYDCNMCDNPYWSTEGVWICSDKCKY